MKNIIVAILFTALSHLAYADEAHNPEAAESLTRDMMNFFGQSTETAGKLLSEMVSRYGVPNAVIKGSEGTGAAVIGYRKGSGTLFFDGRETPIFWNGLSVGLMNYGGNGSRVYVLVYKLQDANQLYRKFTAMEGSAYLGVGGSFQVGGSKFQSDDTGIVIVPIRMGLGLRIGVLTVGYLNFTPSATWLPF